MPAAPLRRKLTLITRVTPWLLALAMPSSAFGCAPASTQEPRQGTASDVAGAALAEAPRAAVMLPAEMAQASTQHDETGPQAPRPRTPHPTLLCEKLPGPEVERTVGRFKRDTVKDTGESSWSLELAGHLGAARPGPVAEPPSAQATQPMRVELRSTSSPERVDVAIESGGWLLCALPTLRVLADGKQVPGLSRAGGPDGTRMPGADPRGERRARRDSQPIDVGVKVGERAAWVTLQLPLHVVRSLLAAQRIELQWDGGRAELHPQQNRAVKALAGHLEPWQAPTAPPDSPGI